MTSSIARTPSVRFSAIVLSAALAAAMPAHAADAPKPEPVKATGPINQLVLDKKYQEAILKVDELRAKSPGKVADAESEFWAAKAELGLNLQQAARDRFLLVARKYPDHARAGEASIEAAVTRLRGLGDGKLTDAQKQQVGAVAKELDEVGSKFADEHDTAARALYVAGNAWKLSGDFEKAVVRWQTVREKHGASTTDYPPKAIALLGSFAGSRDLDIARSKALFSECVSKYGSTETGVKCSKNLARMSVIGTPAPEFTVETWLNSKPVDINELRGNVVLVFFFATWCPHCKAAMPEIEATLARFKGKPLKAVAVTFNSKGQTTEAAKAFAADPANHLSWPAAVDHEGRTSEAYEGGNVPTIVAVDKKGIVRWIDHPVYLDDAVVSKLLAE